jgi:glutamate/tyrosine decarboxylase-like PLP-dependent enzyme
MAGTPGDDDDGLAAALDRALLHARTWAASVAGRRVPAAGTADAAAIRLGLELPAAGLPPAEVVDRLAAAVEPGLMANASGRFFGWVMGSALPAAVAADWLVSAWDQNAGMRAATPGVIGVEDVAAAWLLDLLGLPAASTVGFTTGATTANFTCLAAARGRVLAEAGWDVAVAGLTGAPPVHVLAGEERHGSVDLALRYLGLGAPATVAVDGEGRLEVGALRAALAERDGPTIVCLQAGNLHSGAFDPFPAAVEAARAVGAWVHVDGAFGLWAAVTPRLAALTHGMARAHSWATDAHKTLNTPYDGGIAVVADPEATRTAMGLHASYLLDSVAADPHESVPELSRRARGVPIWAALASLGADGVRALVEGLVAAARDLADGIAGIPGATVVNRVDYTQVCVAFESDERTAAVYQRILAEGEIMPSPSVWHGRVVIRFSVSSFRTGPAEVRDAVAAVARAAAAVPAEAASMHA